MNIWATEFAKFGILVFFGLEIPKYGSIKMIKIWHSVEDFPTGNNNYLFIAPQRHNSSQ